MYYRSRKEQNSQEWILLDGKHGLILRLTEQELLRRVQTLHCITFAKIRSIL